jgi:hypothetical protein
MRVIVAALIVALIGCSTHNEQLARRRAYWDEALKQNVPTGTTKEQIISWGKSQGVAFNPVPQNHWLIANVERVAVEGIKFPCSEWNIIVTVTLDAHEKATRYEISQVGTCV